MSQKTIRKWARYGGFPLLTTGRGVHRKIFTFTSLVDLWLLKNRSVYKKNYEDL